MAFTNTHELYDVAIDARDAKRMDDFATAAALYDRIAQAELDQPGSLRDLNAGEWKDNMADLLSRSAAVRSDPALAARLLRVAARYGASKVYSNVVGWAVWLDDRDQRAAALDLIEQAAHRQGGPVSWLQKEPELARFAAEPRFRAAFAAASTDEVEAYVADFERKRMGGRPLPADLRAMLTWSRSATVDDEWLLDQSAELMSPDEDPFGWLPGPEDPWANAIRAVIQHLIPVARFPDQSIAVGYWVHPAEPADRPPPIVMMAQETADFTVLGSGCSLADVLAHEVAGTAVDEEIDEDLSIDTMIRVFHEHGIEISPDPPLDHPVVVHPQDLFEQTYRDLTG